MYNQCVCLLFQTLSQFFLVRLGKNFIDYYVNLILFYHLEKYTFVLEDTDRSFSNIISVIYSTLNSKLRCVYFEMEKIRGEFDF